MRFPIFNTLIHQLGSPKHFYQITSRWDKPLLITALVLATFALIMGLGFAQWDCKQGGSYRILYIHAPAAWLSMSTYVFMALAAGIGMVWRIKMAETLAISAAPLGAWFTVAALVTGAIWGQPMWGKAWHWDARLTSELILLFLYLGYLGLYSAIEDRQQAANAAAILALVGLINIPIIHFSVEWWNSIHQKATVSKLSRSSAHWTMVVPLLTMLLAAQCYMFYTVFKQARANILEREKKSRWVKEVIEA